MMKHRLLLLSILFVAFSNFGCLNGQASADLIFDHEPKGVMWEYTSTGCPGCGSWGKPKMDYLLTLIGDKVNHAAVHVRFGDPMETDLTQTFYQNRPGRRYTPQFFLNDKACTTLSSEGFLDSTATFDKAIQFANEAYGSAVPLLDGIVTKEKDKLKINYGVQLNSGSSTSYYLSAYLLTSGLQYPQKGYKQGNPIHNNVVLATADEYYGTPVSNSDSIHSKESWFDLAEVEGKPSVLIVLWRKDGSYYYSTNSLRLEVN